VATQRRVAGTALVSPREIVGVTLTNGVDSCGKTFFQLRNNIK